MILRLPPELVDDILTHLRHDNQALQNCSLIAKSWTYSSQKLLYADIRITPSTYRTWQEIASPTSAELLQHTHSLTCRRFDSLYGLHEDYLKSFHRLQELNLDQVYNIELDAVKFFPAFQNTLLSLSLSQVSLTLDALIELLGYFPNLREFRLNGPTTFCAEHRKTPPPSIPPRGTLSLSCISPESTNILLRGLCELEPEYDELRVVEVFNRSNSRIRSIISTCEKTLKRLSFYPSVSVPTLENLSELRELEFNELSLNPEEVTLISTITSTHIQKITFASYLYWDLEAQLWSSLDTELSSLVDRLRTSGYQRVLDVEFRGDLGFAKEASDMGPDGFLPRFSEKGRVTISKAVGGEVLYCSDRLLGNGLDSEDFKGSETAQASSNPV